MSERRIPERVLLSDDGKFFAHIGVLERSGRYPWGSGERPYQRLKDFRAYYWNLRRQGLSDDEIAKGIGMNSEELKEELKSTTQRREETTIKKARATVENVAQAWELKNKGYSNTAIAERMGVTEGTVRNWLKPEADAKAKQLIAIGDGLKEAVAEKGVIDVGANVSRYLHISETKFNATVALLKEEGYNTYTTKVKQLGTGEYTTIKALCPPGMTRAEFLAKYKEDPSIVKSCGLYADSDSTNGEIKKIQPPVPISRDRIFVRYDDDPKMSGSERDGVIQIRPGVEDLDLLGSKYAQVRISVDNKMYMKGMAIYSNDIPDGYDVVYNVNKKSGTPDEKVFKPMYEKGEDNPFGANTMLKGIDEETGEIIYQKDYIGRDGKKHQSALNIVNDEGTWGGWDKSIASQMLSKQSPEVARKQLKIVTDRKQEELDEVMSLTNPTIKKKLLEEFADGCDSDAVHLKGAAFPRQASQVLIPIPSLKDNECYAPNYRDGERVALIRYPHGGTFEIADLVVNNRNREANAILGERSPTAKGRKALDAIGINKSVADQLSGADFDGDSVLVIPNNSGMIKTSPRLSQLKNFSPNEFALPDDAPILVKPTEDHPNPAYRTPAQRTRVRGRQMGEVSNLITDMTIKGADFDEIARAVAHSMVVIDSVKHDLDWKASEKYFGIQELKDKYQAKDDPTKKGGGASTIISRASAEQRVDERKMIYSTSRMTKAQKEAYDRGEYVYEPTGRTIMEKNAAGQWIDTGKKAQQMSTRMKEAKDAAELSSGEPIEEVYVKHANTLKQMALTARAASRKVPKLEQSPSAKKTYANEVESLKQKLDLAEKNRPIERQAALIANATVKAQLESHPELKDDGDQRKKIQNKALAMARDMVGANKKAVMVDITDREWEAIQAGAISDNMLQQILKNTDVDKVRQRATPRASNGLSDNMVARIRAMAASGATQAEIADAVGVSTSSVNKVLG